MNILLVPNSTGSGHNMRMLALGQEIIRLKPQAKLSVLLGSLQGTFVKLFQESGITVIDLSKTTVDHTSKSNLKKEMNWESYIGEYISTQFINSERMLKYCSFYLDLTPDIVICDYNIAASLAAVITKTKFVFVTERYDFTLQQVDDDILRKGGFIVSSDEIKKARKTLHNVFKFIVDNAELVLTDKPYVEELDHNTALKSALNSGKAIFTGPLIRSFDKNNNGKSNNIRETLKISAGPIMVGSIGGTTMFLENKLKIIETYIDSYRKLKRKIPDLNFILLGRDVVQAPEDIIVLSYLPDWMGLLNEAHLLLSAPGWITATEIAALGVPTIFVLPSMSEYHEVEALKKLERLGFPTVTAPTSDQLEMMALPYLSGARQHPSGAHVKMSPDGPGTIKAAKLILSKIDTNNIAPQQDTHLTSVKGKDRMIAEILLHSDGSTTPILESIFESKLHVINENESPVDNKANIPMHLLNKFVVIDDNDVLIRKVDLETESGILASKNTIFARKKDLENIRTKGSAIPIGIQIKKQEIKQFREIISTGYDIWDDQGQMCLSKEYMVSMDNDITLYIKEKYNPLYVDSKL